MIKFSNILIYMTLIGMELSWFYIVLNAVNKIVADRVSIPLLLTLLLLPFILAKVLAFLGRSRPVSTLLVWGIWPIVTMLMLKIQLFSGLPLFDTEWLKSIVSSLSQLFYVFDSVWFIILASALLWWFGGRLAYRRPDFSAAVTEFQFGMVILVITYFCYYQLALDNSAAVPVAFLFFALALIGISVSNAQDNTWTNSGWKSQWSAILVSTIVIVLLLGILISFIITPDVLQSIVNAVVWVWGLFDKLLFWLASLIPADTSITPEMSPLPSIPAEGQAEFVLPAWPDWLLSMLRAIYFIIVGAVFLFAVYRITSDILKWIRRRAVDSGAQVESLRGAFKADLINWLKRILSRLFGMKFGRGKKAKDSSEIESVRHLYIQFLHWGEEQGFTRQEDQTPLEYLNMLVEIRPEKREDLNYITEQYSAVRYGRTPPKEEKYNLLKQIWNNLRKTTLVNKPVKTK